MHRRRSKNPRHDKGTPRTPQAPATAGRSRRRARADTPVPEELKLPPGGLEAVARDKAKAPRAPKPQQAQERPAQAAPAPQPEPAIPAPKPEAPAPKPEARKARAEPPRERRAANEELTPRADGSPERVVLVTGFDPFGGETMNPSWEICKRLPREVAGLRVETCRVPCEFRRAIEVVAEAIERHRPEIVISFGQAGGRTHMSVERVAINVNDARMDDNAGSKPIDEPIAANGPAAYFSTLPIKAMAQAMREAGVPAEVSNTAGTYVCNHLMYGVLHFLDGSGSAARAGFIHVPYAPEQVVDKRDRASLSIETMLKGAQAAVAAAATHTRDIPAAEGKLD